MIPYTYLIGWPDLNTYYYGVRYANSKIASEDLWKEYFTSSNIVLEFRIKHGEPSLIKVDKIFTSKEEALHYETQFLLENNCVKNEVWLNQAAWPVYDWSGKKHKKESKEKIAAAARNRTGSKNSFYGKTHTMETKNKISDTKIGVKIWVDKQHPMLNKKHTKEALIKISEGIKGIKRSSETRAKISEARKGKPRPIVICPYCAKEGATGIMHRWHFENCKVKP